MRDFDAVCAEIDRRSQKLIRQRSRRKHMLMACIPLVLCVGLWAVYPRQKAAPEMPSVAVDSFSSSLQTQAEVIIEIAPDYDLRKVEVSSGDRRRVFWEKARLTELSYFLQVLKPQPEDNGITGEAVEDGDMTYGSTVVMENFSESLTVLADCQIKLTCTDGTVLHYRLQGDVLEDLQTAEKYVLTESQMQTLRSLLELENPEKGWAE